MIIKKQFYDFLGNYYDQSIVKVSAYFDNSFKEFTFFGNGTEASNNGYSYNRHNRFYTKRNAYFVNPYEYIINMPPMNLSGLLSSAPDESLFEPYSCSKIGIAQYNKSIAFPARFHNYVIYHHRFELAHRNRI